MSSQLVWAWGFALAVSVSPTALAQGAPLEGAPRAKDDEEEFEVPSSTSSVPLSPAETPTGNPAPEPSPAVSPTTSAVPSAPDEPAVQSQPTAVKSKPDVQQPEDESSGVRSRPGPSPSFAPGREERRAPSWQDGFSVSGYVQAQYEQNQLSEDQLDASAAPLNSDRFVLRRGRVRLDKRWQYAQAVLELDANTVRGLAVGIRRAEASLVYRRGNADLPVLALTAGILDIPFGYELAESPRTRPFFERSTTSLALFPSEADLGVKLWGAFGFARYAVAITNGEPLDARGFPRDPNRAKDVSGRLGIDLQVQRRLALAAGTSFSFGKGFHAGQVGTKGGVTWRDDNENGAVDAGELIGVPASAPEPSKNFERFALGLDLRAVLSTPLGSSQLAFEGYLASNQDRALYPADPVQTGVDLRESGFSISFVQDVYRYGLIGLRYSLYDPNADWLDQRQGNFQPRSAAVRSVSPVIGLNLADYARLLFQYDFVRDRLARDPRGVPADANNNWFGVRLQVGL